MAASFDDEQIEIEVVLFSKGPPQLARRSISAAQFIERLFGELPAFFKDEDELRAIWSQPDTRKALLAGLSEKGYGRQDLDEIRKMINAEKSDLYDVLAYIAFTLAPVDPGRTGNSKKGWNPRPLRFETTGVSRFCFDTVRQPRG